MTTLATMPMRSKNGYKALPSDPDAERGILGSILLDSTLASQAVNFLQLSDFYDPHHRSIFAAIRELRSLQKQIDPFTIADILRREERLDEVGGTPAITNLSFGLPYFENIDPWLESVKEKARLRALVQFADELQNRALSEDSTSSELIELADSRFKDLGQTSKLIKPRSIRLLWESHRTLRAPVIEGLLRRGEVMNIIAKSKVGKSWLTYILIFSVALGFKLFDQFQCYAGKVLLIDNELHPETIAHRIAAVAYALGIPVEDLADQIHVISLRGQLTDLEQLGRIFADITPGTYQLVILDAWYRFLPKGADENSNSAVAQMYNRLDQYASKEMLDAPIALVHHSSKGGQGDKDVTDVGAGAGAQSRAADTHLILRPHQDENCVVLEAALRSWAPVEPIALRWDFPVWRRAEGVDVTALKGKKPAYEEKRQSEDAQNMEIIYAALCQKPDTVKGLRTRVNMGHDRIVRLIGGLTQAGRITFDEFVNRGQPGKLYRPI